LNIVNLKKVTEKEEELTENSSIITHEEEVQMPPKAPKLRAEPLKFDQIDICTFTASQVLYVQN
jgi:hypothetical protein